MAANNLEYAIDQLIEFAKSESEKAVLLKGTHQFEKHTLVMDLIEQYPFFRTGIFRGNSLQNIPLFLEYAGYGNSRKKIAAGKPYTLSRKTYYFDSLFTQSTWVKSPNTLDFALIYPMDSLCDSKKVVKEEILDNLLKWKKINKIFFVTWTDVRHDWLIPYVDRIVTYDVEEEDPAYHQRVLDLNNPR